MSNEMLTRAGGRATTLDRQARTVEAVALSGLAPAIRPGSSPWVEELQASGADLSSLLGAPVLLDHVATTRTSVGTVASANVDGDRIVCRLQFDGSPEADAIMGKIEAGSVRGVSLGYTTQKRDRVGTDPAGRPIMRATAWKPVELSLTPLPVDAGATVRSNSTMHTTTADQTANPSAADQTAAGIENRADVNRAIRGIATISGLPATWSDELIDRGVSTDEARRLAFDAMSKRSTVVDNRSPRIEVGTSYDDPAVMRRSMADALAHRLSPQHCKLEGAAVQYRSHGPLALLGQLLAARGEKLSPWDREGLLTRAVGAHSSSDFPLLLADAANKSLLAQYQAAAPTYRMIAARRPFNDFKAHKFLRLGDFPTFKSLSEGGEVKYGTISENQETVTPDEFATGIAIGRKALLNDDLSALGDFSALIAVRSAQFENGKVYALLASVGPTMSDSLALFHATHANYQGTGTTIANGIDAAVLAVRAQTGLDGAKLNLRPRYLVVGAAQEANGRRILAAINPTQASNVNPWAGQFDLVVDNEVSGNAWHMAADPAQIPCLVYGYVNGAEGPQIMTERDFDTQAVKVRAGLDFACGAIDFRGLYKNAGA
ncbi:MAG: peptidase [Azospirillum sp.]|nr:peptidase [Azospirillum sp.]